MQVLNEKLLWAKTESAPTPEDSCCCCLMEYKDIKEAAGARAS